MQKEICFVETFLGEEPGPAFFVLLRLPQVLSHFFIARGVLAGCWASEGTEQLPETHFHIRPLLNLALSFFGMSVGILKISEWNKSK